MGSDEAALLRLRREKRGEAEPEDRAIPASADREQRELLPGLDCHHDYWTAGSVAWFGLFKHLGCPKPPALWPTPPVPFGA
jgi:hypothetical protein